MGAYFTCGPTCAAAASAGYTAAGGGSIIGILHSAVAAYNLGQQIQTGQVSSGAVRTEFALGAAVDIEEGLEKRNGGDCPASNKLCRVDPPIPGGGKFANGARTAAMAHLFNAELAELNAQEGNSLDGVTRTDIKNGIVYDRDGASVLVQNDEPGGAIPTVGNRQVLDALDVSADTGRQVQIISGERGPGHPLYRAGSTHAVDGAIDVRIRGFNSEQTADVLHRSGNFNRVSSYIDGRSSAHADYRATGNQGRFVNWIWQGN